MTMWAADLDRVLEAMAESLTDSVLPHVENHYAQQQVRAARELLLNLGSRVEWRTDEVRASIDAITAALGAIGSDDTAPAAAGSDIEQLIAVRRTLGESIDGVYGSGQDGSEQVQALERIWSVVRFEFDAEAERIRTGMHA